jgi:uncharacterized protein
MKSLLAFARNLADIRTVPILSRGVAGAVLLVLLIGSAVGISRIELERDISALLPNREEGAESISQMARRWGMLQKVVILVGPDGHGSGLLFRAMDTIEKRVARLDGVAQVMSRIEMSQAKRAVEVISKHSSRLYRRGGTELNDAEILRRLGQLKNRLAAPEAMVMQDQLLADPLGFGHGALQGLEAAGHALGATMAQGRLVSKDLKNGIIVLSLDFDPFDVDRAQSFVSQLEQTIDEAMAASDMGDLKVVALGGVHFAASSAGAIMSDIQLAFILTSVLVLVIFGVFFRRLRLLPAALIPGGVGIIVALGVLGLAGVRLHALTLGFAATITGISVDYAIHLLHRALAEDGSTSRVRMSRALDAVARPVILGCLTTVGAFILVATSGFVGLRQMALFASISVPVAMLTTLVLLPAHNKYLLGTHSAKRNLSMQNRFLSWLNVDEITMMWRICMIGGFAVILGVGIYWSTRVPMSGDPRDLGYRDQDLALKEQILRQRFPGLTNQAMLVARGETLEQALIANDRLFENLVAHGFLAREIISLSSFLPSKKTQVASIEEVHKLFSGNSKVLVDDLFVQSGFTRDYASGLADRLVSDPLTRQSYSGTSLADVLDDAIKEEGGQFFVLTRVRSDDDVTAARLEKVAAMVSGCRLASERLDTHVVLRLLQGEIVRMLSIWLVAALVILSLFQRSVWFGPRAALPAVIGVAVSVGIFGMLGRPLTPVASAGIILVMGLGIDYGIFMQQVPTGERRGPAAAVLASAMTTVAAFGVLGFADTRAMADMGLIIFIGVTAALCAALYLVPSLMSSRLPGEKS